MSVFKKMEAYSITKSEDSILNIEAAMIMGLFIGKIKIAMVDMMLSASKLVASPMTPK
ncbi:hypothetical protein ECHJAX_0459 [Ehrlichia chaffeensis str. Jax]|nr:hypothetical protein ECHJAX_0459 [Ehrlichia chaffeensis str. Jax]